MGGFLSDLKPETNEEVLKTPFGPIRGNIYKHGEKIVDGYLGIPYAKPPVGELRFKKPEAAEAWTETRDCTKYGPIAPQNSFFGPIGPPRPPMDEGQCLSLNVFAPRWTSDEFKSGRPVMVFIHGGGYELSSSADYNDYSLTGTLPLKDVIVVTLNYRLGVLGFFTTGDDVCRGNMGLWDQTLALKWVHDHIVHFGGDADNITVFGQSAGGASTDLLSLSPHSRDLFRKFIPMSGSAHCDFALRTSKNQATIFRELAVQNGYTGDDSESLLQWFKEQPQEFLVDVTKLKKSISGFLTYTPNLDGDFFPKPLDELRKEASKKSMMTGICEYEGLILAFMDPAFTTADDSLKKQLAGLIGPDTHSNPEEARKKLYEIYVNGVDKSDEAAMKKKLTELVGDSFFDVGVLESAKNATKHGNDVYLYSFEYCTPKSFGMFGTNFPFEAATHCTDLRYVFGEGVYSKFEPNEEDLKLLDHTGLLFTNFAKYGNPNGKDAIGWEKYTLDKPGRHFRISIPTSEMREKFQNGRTQVWEESDKESNKYQAIVYGK